MDAGRGEEQFVAVVPELQPQTQLLEPLGLDQRADADLLAGSNACAAVAICVREREAVDQGGQASRRGARVVSASPEP